MLRQKLQPTVRPKMGNKNVASCLLPNLSQTMETSFLRLKKILQSHIGKSYLLNIINILRENEKRSPVGDLFSAFLAPKGGQCGNDLFFTGHHLRQEGCILLGIHIERLSDGRLIAQIN